MRIFLFGIIIYYFYAEVYADNFKALIFNRITNALIYLPEKVPPTKCNFWRTLCPAKNDREREFNKKFSLNNRALFVQETLLYMEDRQCETLAQSVCEEPIKLSLAFREKPKIYEFGYEIYFPEYDTDNFRKMSQNEFYTIAKMKEAMTFAGTAREMYKAMAEKRVELMMGRITQAFTWIPLFKAKVARDQLRHVEYEIRKNNIDPMASCDDFSLGNEIFVEKEVDSFYSDDTQTKMFKNIALPGTSSSSSRTSKSDERAEGACTPEFRCLKKWSLVPTDQFQFGPSSAPLICSNMTTVPIWSSTLEGIMLKLDKFLYALHRVSGQPLRILAGVVGMLKLPRKELYKVRNKRIMLNSDNLKIIAPKIIFKIVKLKINPCKSGEKCWYGVLIVIHNDPNFTRDQKVCDDISGELGWEEIRYETWSHLGAQSKFIYVCEISKNSMESIKITYEKKLEIQKLSLIEFPYINKEKTRSSMLIKDKIFKELERLSKPGEKMELESVSPIERPAYNNNFDFAGDEEAVYSDGDEGRGNSEGEEGEETEE